MMKTLQTYVDKFQEQGYKITPQRRGIFEILVGNESHPKAEDIYDALRAKMPDVSLATVYNTLSTLKEMGMVNLLSITEDNSIHYDPTTEVHDHLFCLGCSRIFDVDRDTAAMDFSKREYSWVPTNRQDSSHLLWVLSRLSKKEKDRLTIVISRGNIAFNNCP